MKYICRNPNCKKYNQEETLIKEAFKYKGGRLVGEHCNCPVCGKEREEVNPNIDVPLSEKGVNIGQYSSMSATERRESLRKRSHEHFNKEIKERRDDMQSQVKSEWREYNKMKK